MTYLCKKYTNLPIINSYYYRYFSCCRFPLCLSLPTLYTLSILFYLSLSLSVFRISYFLFFMINSIMMASKDQALLFLLYAPLMFIIISPFSLQSLPSFIRFIIIMTHIILISCSSHN